MIQKYKKTKKWKDKISWVNSFLTNNTSAFNSRPNGIEQLILKWKELGRVNVKPLCPFYYIFNYIIK